MVEMNEYEWSYSEFAFNFNYLPIINDWIQSLYGRTEASYCFPLDLCAVECDDATTGNDGSVSIVVSSLQSNPYIKIYINQDWLSDQISSQPIRDMAN
jgi:hypothetical protein